MPDVADACMGGAADTDLSKRPSSSSPLHPALRWKLLPPAVMPLSRTPHWHARAGAAGMNVTSCKLPACLTACRAHCRQRKCWQVPQQARRQAGTMTERSACAAGEDARQLENGICKSVTKVQCTTDVISIGTNFLKTFIIKTCYLRCNRPLKLRADFKKAVTFN